MCQPRCDRALLCLRSPRLDHHVCRDLPSDTTPGDSHIKDALRRYAVRPQNRRLLDMGDPPAVVILRRGAGR